MKSSVVGEFQKPKRVLWKGVFTMETCVRQLVIGLCLTLTLVVAFPWSTLAQQKAKLRPLHIALANHSVSMTAIYVAKQLGIFETYGYDARVLVLEPRAGIGALLSGDLDCYTAI